MITDFVFKDAVDLFDGNIEHGKFSGEQVASALKNGFNQYKAVGIDNLTKTLLS